jgi:heme-degrading monooxygenase HmoA
VHVNYIEWYVTPFRADRWLEVWRPALDRALAAGASACYLTRNIDNPLHFRQVSVWEDRDDFENWWASDEITRLRQDAMNWYHKPIVSVWHSLAAEAALDRSEA